MPPKPSPIKFDVDLLPDADDDDDPPVGATGNAEVDSQQELSAVLSGFKGRAQVENQRFLDATDSEYWFAVCFQTREQKEEFLEKLKLMEIGDKYLDGMEVAKALGIELESRVPDLPRVKTFDLELVSLALD